MPADIGAEPPASLGQFLHALDVFAAGCRVVVHIHGRRPESDPDGLGPDLVVGDTGRTAPVSVDLQGRLQSAGAGRRPPRCRPFILVEACGECKVSVRKWAGSLLNAYYFFERRSGWLQYPDRKGILQWRRELHFMV